MVNYIQRVKDGKQETLLSKDALSVKHQLSAAVVDSVVGSLEVAESQDGVDFYLESDFLVAIKPAVEAEASAE